MLQLLSRKKPSTIYLSYVEDDRFYAETVEKLLRQAGYNVCSTPQHYTGAKYTLMSESFIDHADAVVSVVSPASTRSNTLWRDVAYARVNDCPVLPIAVHHLPQGMPFVDAIDAADDIHAGCHQLLAALDTVPAYADNCIEPEPAARHIPIAATVAVMMVMSVISVFASAL